MGDSTVDITFTPEEVALLNTSITMLKQENKRLREALKYYAEEENYARGLYEMSEIEDDNGRTAQKALILPINEAFQLASFIMQEWRRLKQDD